MLPKATAVHALRAPPADFTGRAEELRDLAEKMGAGGVTISGLHGQGGIGKTALGLKLAEALVPRCPDAQIDLDLKGSSEAPLSPAAVMAQVIHAFEPTARLPEGEAELGAIYRSVLHGKRVLLFFDNAKDRAQVEPLLPPAGSVMIVTSRQRFVLPGLYARSLDELAPAEAIALVRRIARRLTLGEAAEIAGICGRLPLALRLAASALAERVDLEPAEYVERLKTEQARLELVEASLRLSLEMLDARLQTFWCCLGVFPGDFEREAAAAVGALELAVAREALGELIKHSMVDYDPIEKRCRLHDLSRVYAVSRLQEAERTGADRRHAEHYKGVTASASELYEKGGASMVTGLALFDREWANIEAGQAWAATHAAMDDVAADLCSDYPNVGVYCFSLRQHPRDQIGWREVGLTAARRRGQRAHEGAHLCHLGLAYGDMGEHRRAIEMYERALTVCLEIGHRSGEGASLGNLGLAYVALGEPHRAIGLYEQHLAICLETGNRRGQSIALGNLAEAYAKLKDPRRAIALATMSLLITRAIGDQRGEGHALGTLGEAYTMLGQPHRAIELTERWLIIAREIGDQQGESIASWNLGEAYEALGELEKAIASMQIRVDFERAIGHRDAEKDAVRVEALRARRKG